MLTISPRWAGLQETTSYNARTPPRTSGSSESSEPRVIQGIALVSISDSLIDQVVQIIEGGLAVERVYLLVRD